MYVLHAWENKFKIFELCWVFVNKSGILYGESTVDGVVLSTIRVREKGRETSLPTCEEDPKNTSVWHQSGLGVTDTNKTRKLKSPPLSPPSPDGQTLTECVIIKGGSSIKRRVREVQEKREGGGGGGGGGRGGGGGGGGGV